MQKHSLSLQTVEYTSSPRDLQGKHSHAAKSCRNLVAFFGECSIKVQYSEANNLIIMLSLLDENAQIFYNCAFCRVGVLVWVDSDHARRDGQGTPTHLPSQGGNTPKQFYCIIPSTAPTFCCPVSHCYFCFDKSWHLFCFSFLPRHVLPFSS